MSPLLTVVRIVLADTFNCLKMTLDGRGNVLLAAQDFADGLRMFRLSDLTFVKPFGNSFFGGVTKVGEEIWATRRFGLGPAGEIVKFDLDGNPLPSCNIGALFPSAFDLLGGLTYIQETNRIMVANYQGVSDGHLLEIDTNCGLVRVINIIGSTDRMLTGAYGNGLYVFVEEQIPRGIGTAVVALNYTTEAVERRQPFPSVADIFDTTFTGEPVPCAFAENCRCENGRRTVNGDILSTTNFFDSRLAETEVRVTGRFESNGTVSLVAGAVVTVAQSITLSNPTLVLYNPLPGTYEIMRGRSLAGTFSSVRVIEGAFFGQTRQAQTREVFSTLGTVTPSGSTVTVTYTPTSALVTVTPPSSSGLPTAAYIGIGVGTVVVGVTIVVIIVVVSVRKRNRFDAMAKQRIKEREIDLVYSQLK